MNRISAAVLILLCALTMPSRAHAEDGYELWLRYRPRPAAQALALHAAASTVVLSEPETPTLKVAAAELVRGIAGMTGRAPAATTQIADGAILLGTGTAMDRAGLKLGALAPDEYIVRRATLQGARITVIAGGDASGALYGAFAYLRALGAGALPEALDMRSQPGTRLRLLNHWDNLDRSVERGYAGQSIWDWWTLPDYVDPRIVDYARANASIGINGTVLNNVNAKADSLTAPYIAKAAAIADTLRPYGMQVYLSARFSAPIEIGGLKSADPLDPAVAAWWRMKAAEIYHAIPDFGGFLVKANSEGQPGPQDYRRTHADGANMLAAAVAPHGGVVIWRAFVYAAENPDDRAKQAYTEFKPLDGTFATNVLLQVKNGPLDFQPREPFHPLFGAMPKTPLMMEFQITKEYLGFATHLAYLGPLYEEALESQTGIGPNATVAHVIDGSQEGHRLTGMAGVANIGSDRNWSGSTFDQANWYVFGRMAWDPSASARTIAEEWVRQTLTEDNEAVRTIVDMMMGAREAVVNYMTPLGLAHLMATGHHYGPGPWVDTLPRADWNPVYYHRADADGIGFDRTTHGTNAVTQYAPIVAHRLNDKRTTPLPLLLWFHRVGWDERLPDGQTLWETLVGRYDLGVRQVTAMRAKWDTLAPYIDGQRYSETAAFLKIQERDAQWWRDACIAYFQSVSGRPLPAGVAPSSMSLMELKALSFPYAPGH